MLQILRRLPELYLHQTVILNLLSIVVLETFKFKKKGLAMYYYQKKTQHSFLTL